SICIHIIDRKSKKYSAHFMMWLNSYLLLVIEVGVSSPKVMKKGCRQRMTTFLSANSPFSP
ncbi:hypothetical protein V2J23_14735, partial [Geobacillus thermoleovorans]|uniref:hypothetical protein n=1 Tax=Geobacillus thermoleovorans TaxID=33941 RepID=UPI00345BD06A